MVVHNNFKKFQFLHNRLFNIDLTGVSSGLNSSELDKYQTIPDEVFAAAGMSYFWTLGRFLECSGSCFGAGEAYEEPRLTCWYGELPYTYAFSTMPANPQVDPSASPNLLHTAVGSWIILLLLLSSQWNPVLATLRQAVAQVSGCTFNSLLCNLYRDGHDSIGWHSDDEASLGVQPTIASLSLGDTRVFSLRKQPPPVRQRSTPWLTSTSLQLSEINWK